MANMILSIIHRSTNKLLVGKTYWKNIIIPEILYGIDNIVYNKNELEQIQKSENQAYRLILTAPRYTPIEILRSEIGSSTVETRDIITKTTYLKHLLESDNEMIKEIIKHDIENSITPYSQIMHRYLQEMKMNLNYILNKNKNQLKNDIKKIDLEKWKENIKNKTSLNLYNNFKQEIKEEQNAYDNTEAARTMFRARSNTLKLKWRNKFTKEKKNDIICPMCKIHEETLKHFLIECPELDITRRKMKDTNTEQEKIRRLLNFEKDKEQNEEGKKILQEMWNLRKKKIQD